MPNSPRQSVVLTGILWVTMAGLFTPSPLSAADRYDLNEKTFRYWRNVIRIKEHESGWRDIDWRLSFWSGLIDAQKARKPLLLSLYGGDMLGHC